MICALLRLVTVTVPDLRLGRCSRFGIVVVVLISDFRQLICFALLWRFTIVDCIRRCSSSHQPSPFLVLTLCAPHLCDIASLPLRSVAIPPYPFPFVSSQRRLFSFLLYQPRCKYNLGSHLAPCHPRDSPRVSSSRQTINQPTAAATTAITTLSSLSTFSYTYHTSSKIARASSSGPARLVRVQ